MRKLTSYRKVREVISWLIRSRSIFIARERILDKHYLSLGCGLHLEHGMVNLDWHWIPGLDVCWDLSRGQLPFPDEHFKGVMSEHCIDGLPVESIPALLHEVHRVLRKGGRLRMGQPDGELYCTLYVRSRTDPSVRLPFMEDARFPTPMLRLNRLFRHPSHSMVFDEETLRRFLLQAGFAEVRRCAFGEGGDPELIRDKAVQRHESFYMEAIK